MVRSGLGFGVRTMLEMLKSASALIIERSWVGDMIRFSRLTDGEVTIAGFYHAARLEAACSFRRLC